MKTILLVISSVILSLILIPHASAQVFTDKVRKDKPLERDSGEVYEDALPILGRRAFDRGYDLPYSAGLSANYLYQESSILIRNLQVGFNGSQLFPLDDIIRFNDATARTDAMNFRPDVWLFPFLNVYGIFAYSQTSTTVDFSINIPNGTGYTEILNSNTQADFQATTVGFGLTPTFGVHGGFIALDMNFSWSDIPELSKPAYAFVFGPRIGKNFRFKDERALAVWVGGFRVDIASGTDGQLPLNSLFEFEDLANKIENGYIHLDEAQVQLDTWWAGLTPQQKAQNAGKYAAAQAAISKAGDLLNGVETAASGISKSTVEYSLDKRQENLWNLVVGAQFQINKHWMIRGEYGFLGTRDQFLGGVQYRFGL
ncbi:hypothetical protein KFE98_08165 [bacterium SCSIO 12741]|nr:hypothetical protein KFE98_08165 [bacterium SCSIO 12741]